MQYVFALFLVALLLSPLYFIYRRKVAHKPVRSALLANIIGFFVVGFAFVGAGIFGLASAASEGAGAVVSGPMDPQAGLGMIAAALSTGLSGIGGGIAVAAAASSALGALSEDERIFGKALIFVALAEGIALYGMVISFIILGKF